MQLAQHAVLVPQPLLGVGPVEDQAVVGTGLLEEDGAAGTPVPGLVRTAGVAEAHRTGHLVVADQDRALVRLLLVLDEGVRDARRQVEGGQPQIHDLTAGSVEDQPLARAVGAQPAAGAERAVAVVDRPRVAKAPVGEDVRPFLAVERVAQALQQPPGGRRVRRVDGAELSCLGP
ncbi:hypothetical protein [Streptomyces sp. NPDC056399]|uniref:hypothetical protein n=1 Tax=Streptomyces sp. NPDC056399 TaxID=3345807 RepID=UPI0035E0A2C2